MNFSLMSEAHATVMGPGDDLSPSNILIPPKLRSDTDKMLWREAVFEWADNLIGCAAAGDNRAKGAAATLGLSLYRSLEFSKKELVKKAVRIGELILTPKDEENKIDQRQVVEKIVGLVAKDSTVDRLQRVVRLYKGINSCRRKSNEAIGEYVERFAGLALSYLNLTNADQDSSDSQNFGIVLLLNANLSSQTFANIISNLVVSSKMKTCEAVQTMQISTKRVDLLVDILHNVTSKNMDEQVVERAVECMRTLKAATQEYRKSCLNDERSSRIGLQDAIQALEEIKLEEKYLQDRASKEPKPESATKSFLASNKFNKKMKKRRRISHEEIEGQARTDGKSIPDEEKNSEEITPQNNSMKDKNYSRFKRNRSEVKHDKKDDRKPFFR